MPRTATVRSCRARSIEGGRVCELRRLRPPVDARVLSIAELGKPGRCSAISSGCLLMRILKGSGCRIVPQLSGRLGQLVCCVDDLFVRLLDRLGGNHRSSEPKGNRSWAAGLGRRRHSAPPSPCPFACDRPVALRLNSVKARNIGPARSRRHPPGVRGTTPMPGRRYVIQGHQLSGLPGRSSGERTPPPLQPRAMQRELPPPPAGTVPIVSAPRS